MTDGELERVDYANDLGEVATSGRGVGDNRLDLLVGTNEVDAAHSVGKACNMEK